MATTEEKMAIHRAAEALRAGVMTEGEFLRATDAAWRRTAAYVYRHWRGKLPAHVEVDDVLQELRLQVLQHVRAYDPARGSSIGKFVRWGAIHRTQREINRWRGASLHGNEGANPGRPETTFTQAFSPDVDPLATFGTEAIDREEQVEDYEGYKERVAECETAAGAVARLALWHAGGSVPDAVRLIMGDIGARLECGVSTARGARRLVEREAAVLAAGAHEEVERLARAGAVTPPDDLFEGEEDRASGTVVNVESEPGSNAAAA